MKRALFFMLVGVASIGLAQPFESISIKSQAKTIWIELESLNQLIIRQNTEAGTIRFQFNNHDSYPEPILMEKGDLVELMVKRDQQHLPQAQQNKYRAGQPLYPNYILEVPLNIQLKLRYKQGNTQVSNFSGELELYLDHGTVDLWDLNGSAKVQSYGGVINSRLANARVQIESKEGQVTTNIRDVRLTASDRRINGVYGQATNILHITTILGKVNLSQPEDK